MRFSPAEPRESALVEGTQNEDGAVKIRMLKRPRGASKCRMCGASSVSRGDCDCEAPAFCWSCTVLVQGSAFARNEVTLDQETGQAHYVCPVCRGKRQLVTP